MNVCSNCKTKTDDKNAFFCGQCGIELKKLPKQVSWQEFTGTTIPSDHREISPIISRVIAFLLTFIIIFSALTFIIVPILQAENTGSFSLVPLNEYDLEDDLKYPVHAVNNSIMFSASSRFLTEIDVIYIRAFNLNRSDMYRIEIAEYHRSGSYSITKYMVHDKINHTIDYSFSDVILYGGNITFSLWGWSDREYFLTKIGVCTLFVQSD